MKTTDFYSPISSAKLQENLQKQFGSRVNLGNYDREQLEDIRNKLRTRIFQQEGSAGINDLLTNETYQKDKAMLELLNTRIKEMLGENIKKLRDKMDELSENKKGVRAVKHPRKGSGSEGPKITGKGPKAAKDYDGDGKIETGSEEHRGSVDKAIKKSMAKKKTTKVKESENPFSSDYKSQIATKPGAKAGFDSKKISTGTVYSRKAKKDDAAPEKKVKETSTPVNTKVPAAMRKAKGGDWKAKLGDPAVGNPSDDPTKLSSTAGLKAAAKKLPETTFRRNVKTVNESLDYLLREDEEGKAKTITAAGDMVNDFTSWMQRVGQYQTKSMIELADAIKADFGSQEAEQFKAMVAPALTTALETLTAQRETISNAVAQLAGGEIPPAPMGMEPPVEPGMDMAEPDEMNMPPEDEFGASDAAAGGMSTAGREMRESQFVQRISESHSIMSKLAK
jgi:hypothetical protein